MVAPDSRAHTFVRYQGCYKTPDESGERTLAHPSDCDSEAAMRQAAASSGGDEDRAGGRDDTCAFKVRNTFGKVLVRD
jgi:hypothetical protein